MTPPYLYATCLGGRAPGARVELHDVAFAVGPSLEACHEQLLDAWFGDPDGLHIDAFARLDAVDGHRVELGREPQPDGPRLYFVNVGGYRPGEFGERHAWSFYVGTGPAEVKARAKRDLLAGKDSVHRDDLYDVDDVVAVPAAGGWHVHLTPAPGVARPEIVNGYFPLPRATIEAWKSRGAR
jgi:hypothetical protein